MSDHLIQACSQFNKAGSPSSGSWISFSQQGSASTWHPSILRIVMRRDYLGCISRQTVIVATHYKRDPCQCERSTGTSIYFLLPLQTNFTFRRHFVRYSQSLKMVMRHLAFALYANANLSKGGHLLSPPDTRRHTGPNTVNVLAVCASFVED